MENRRSTNMAIITEIQRFCVHDGPGIRTLVFFKGCPLKCIWCQNPETLSSSVELFFSKSECIHCGLCVDLCPEKAITLTPEGVVFDKSLCKVCGRCVEYCYSGARRLVGRAVTVEQVLEELMKDAVFFMNSGGGVTLSGGEVSVYPLFAEELLKKLKGKRIHTAIETCGYAKWPDLKRILYYTDLVLFDIKHTNSQKHRHFTGVDNKKILDNLVRISRLSLPIIIRFPLIPGVNNDQQTLEEVARLAKNAKAKEIHILTFHHLGKSKWLSLGRTYRCAHIHGPSQSEIDKATKVFVGYGLSVNVGGSGAQ